MQQVGQLFLVEYPDEYASQPHGMGGKHEVFRGNADIGQVVPLFPQISRLAGVCAGDNDQRRFGKGLLRGIGLVASRGEERLHVRQPADLLFDGRIFHNHEA